MPKVTQLVGGSPGPKPGPSEAEMRAFFLRETLPEPEGAELRASTGQLRPPHWGCSLGSQPALASGDVGCPGTRGFVACMKRAGPERDGAHSRPLEAQLLAPEAIRLQTSMSPLPGFLRARASKAPPAKQSLT